jgi:hypothetical protein
MPGIKVSEVRAGMAAQLDVAFGTEVQVATAPDQITPPCLLIGMPTIEYHQAFQRGLDKMEIPIFGILPRTHDQAAVDLADLWISGAGPQSVLTLLEQDRTLGGACQTLVVRDAVAEIYTTGAIDLPTYHWTVEVYG